MEDQLLHGQATKLVNAYQKQSQTRARRPKQIGKEEKRTYVNRAATKVASVNPHLEVLIVVSFADDEPENFQKFLQRAWLPSQPNFA